MVAMNKKLLQFQRKGIHKIEKGIHNNVKTLDNRVDGGNVMVAINKPFPKVPVATNPVVIPNTSIQGTGLNNISFLKRKPNIKITL